MPFRLWLLKTTCEQIRRVERRHLETAHSTSLDVRGEYKIIASAALALDGPEFLVAAAYTLVLHAALWLPITLLGIYYMIKFGLGWSDFDRATQQVSQGETAS